MKAVGVIVEPVEVVAGPDFGRHSDHHTGAVNWTRLRRALAIVAGGTALVAIVAGVARLAASGPAGVWYRATALLLSSASLMVVVALLAIALTIGEQRAEANEERLRQLAEAQRAYHDDR